MTDMGSVAYPLAIAVVEGLQLDNVGVSDDAHDLQFSILRLSAKSETHCGSRSHLETFVLEDSLDRSVLTAGRQFGLKDHTERSIADNLALGVGKVSSLPSHTILYLFADDFCSDVSVL